MNIQDKKTDYVFSQGLANLKLEGMSLSKGQDRIARQYQSGKINRDELVQEALKYARSS